MIVGAFNNWLDVRGIDDKPSWGCHIGSIAKTKGVGSGLLAYISYFIVTDF